MAVLVRRAVRPPAARIDIETSHAFEREIARGCEGIKPGWIRVNLNYFISETVFDYILRAVALVARDGWRLTPWYRFEPASGLWRHAAGAPEPPLSLDDIRYAAGGLRHPRIVTANPSRG